MKEILTLINENHDNPVLLRELRKLFRAKKSELEYLADIPATEHPTLVSHSERFPSLKRYPREVHEAVASQMIYFQALMTAGPEIGTFNAVMSIDTILRHLGVEEAEFSAK